MRKIGTPQQDQVYHGVFPAAEEGSAPQVTYESLKEYLQAVGAGRLLGFVFPMSGEGSRRTARFPRA